jgi:cyclic-di-GMP-binding protein
VLNHPQWSTLESGFWNVSHPLDSAARAAFSEYSQHALMIWQRLAAGSIRPLSVYRSTLVSRESVDAALRILARIYAGCNLAYAPTPPGFWRTVYSITGYVVSQCRDGKEAEFDFSRNMCLQLWLMAWLNPLSLVAGRLPVAVRLVGLLSKSCSYSLAPPTHAGSGLAAADLMDDKPPSPFGRIAGDWNPQLPLYVNAQSAAYAIEGLRNSSNSHTRESDMYEALLGAGRLAGLTAPEVHDFVKRALREFGQTHTRAIPRIAAQGFVNAITGMIEVWSGLQEHDSTARPPNATETKLSGQVVNHSDGGFLLKFRPEQPRLRAGSLLAMRGTDNEPWTLCAIRWLQDNTREVLVGVEVLSNFAEATLCIDSEEQQQAPLITYETDGQTLVYIPLGQSDSKAVVQVNVRGDTWVLSAVRELGEDWELRAVLDRVTQG